MQKLKSFLVDFSYDINSNKMEIGVIGMQG